jgi:hypothetical protein
MKIQPMRKKTPVSVQCTFKLANAGYNCKKNPSNSASFQDIENIIIVFYGIYFRVQIVFPDYNEDTVIVRFIHKNNTLII